jgi:hypothetical protein
MASGRVTTIKRDLRALTGTEPRARTPPPDDSAALGEAAPERHLGAVADYDGAFGSQGCRRDRSRGVRGTLCIEPAGVL